MWELLTGEEPYANRHWASIIGMYVTLIFAIAWSL